MGGLETALFEGAGPARVRKLLEDELRHGRADLARKRSGYDRPVLVAVASAPGALRAVAPAAVALRADPQVVNERTWLLVAALVGALVEVAGEDAIEAGGLGDDLVLQVAGAAEDAELVPLAFEIHAQRIDRLRVRAVALPAGALDDASDLRAPIGHAHPLVVAAKIAALGGRPAEEASMEEHEEAVLAILETSIEGVPRPHDDPDPARRVARRILQRLDGMGKWGGYHTAFDHLARGFAGNDRALADAAGEALLDAGLLAEKPSVGQRHVYLDPGHAGEIRALIDHGDVPAGLKLPR